jgi:hypothetical protein
VCCDLLCCDLGDDCIHTPGSGCSLVWWRPARAAPGSGRAGRVRQCASEAAIWIQKLRSGPGASAGRVSTAPRCLVRRARAGAASRAWRPVEDPRARAPVRPSVPLRQRAAQGAAAPPEYPRAFRSAPGAGRPLHDLAADAHARAAGRAPRKFARPGPRRPRRPRRRPAAAGPPDPPSARPRQATAPGPAGSHEFRRVFRRAAPAGRAPIRCGCSYRLAPARRFRELA